MIATRHLDYLVEADMVELASFMFVDPIDRRDELTMMASLAILHALHPSIIVFSHVYGFSLGVALVFIEDCTDGLLAEGVACCEVEQLPRGPWFVASELVDECLIGCARDECSDHVHVHDIGELIALLGEVADVLA